MDNAFREKDRFQAIKNSVPLSIRTSFYGFMKLILDKNKKMFKISANTTFINKQINPSSTEVVTYKSKKVRGPIIYMASKYHNILDQKDS